MPIIHHTFESILSKKANIDLYELQLDLYLNLTLKFNSMDPPQEIKSPGMIKPSLSNEQKRSNSPISLSSKASITDFRNKFQIELGKLASSDTKNIVMLDIGYQ